MKIKKSIVLVLVAFFMQMALAAENRVALVVGNSGYAGEAKLTNPESDARAMHKELTALGFTVDLVLDADRQEMNKALGKFIKSLDKDTVALFYFAGHGFQVDGANYLLPLKAEADDLYVAKNNSVALNQVFDAFRSAATRLNVVILDCCRNNPFTNQGVNRAIRSFSRSLADQAAPLGTIITFSTSAGDLAADGEGGNSPFTHALTAELARRPEDGLLLSAVLRNTAKEVYRKTGQDPILNIPGSAEEVFLFGAKAQPVKNSGPDNSTALQQADLMKRLAELRQELDEYKKQSHPPAPPSPQGDLAGINTLLDQQKVDRANLEAQIASLLAVINAANKNAPGATVVDGGIAGALKIAGTPRAIGETVKDSLNAFFDAHLQTMRANSARAWAGMFTANPWYCYANGKTTHATLIRGRQELIDKYRNRSYTVLESGYTELDGGSRALMTFTYRYQYSGTRHTSGRCREDIGVVWVVDKWLISTYQETLD